MKSSFTLAELAELFEAQVIGNSQYRVTGAATAAEAASGDLVFVETENQFAACARSGVATISRLFNFSDPSMVAQAVAAQGLICSEPRLQFLAASRLLSAHDELADFTNEHAWVAPTASVHPSARLAPGCVIHAGARIEAFAALYPGVTVERGGVVGAGCIVRSHAVIGPDARLDPLCEIGAGSVIGANPQQFEAANGVWARQLNQTRVRLGKRVAVGANTVIESGARRETVIEDDVLIGGQVYVAHDCQLKRGVLIIGQSGLASGVCVETGAALMGRVMVNVDVNIGAGALVMATSGVTKDVTPGARVWGNPARSRNEALRKLKLRATQQSE